MALKLMPGETRNFVFKLPVAVSALNTVNVRFFQNDEKVVEYDSTDTENGFASASFIRNNAGKDMSAVLNRFLHPFSQIRDWNKSADGFKIFRDHSGHQ